MMNQGKLLTKLNPRCVRVFKSLPWLGIEFYASKISISLYLFILYCVQKYLVCITLCSSLFKLDVAALLQKNVMSFKFLQHFMRSFFWTKVFFQLLCAYSLSLKNFWQKVIGKKAAYKKLVKLTIAR